MGQTSGGNSGGLELLERVSATEDQIEGVVNPVLLSYPVLYGLAAINIEKNDSLIGSLSMFTVTTFETWKNSFPTINIKEVPYTIFSKIDNANPFNFNPGQAKSQLALFMSGGNLLVTTNSITHYYDGVNTYLLMHQPSYNAIVEEFTTKGYTQLVVWGFPVLVNTQPTVN